MTFKQILKVDLKHNKLVISDSGFILVFQFIDLFLRLLACKSVLNLISWISEN